MSSNTENSSMLPAKDEQLLFQNTNVLLRQNLIRLQLSELTKNVQDLCVKRRHKIGSWIDSLIKELKLNDSHSLNGKILSLKWMKDSGLVGFNSPDEQELDSFCLCFQSPLEIDLIGSYAIGTATCPILNCDIAFTIPSECLNPRYTYL